MFEGKKFLHPYCAGGVLVFDVLLFNSLAGNKKWFLRPAILYGARIEN